MIDRRDEAFRQLAEELLSIQQGSQEDAILLLDEAWPMNKWQRDRVIYWINRLGSPPRNDGVMDMTYNQLSRELLFSDRDDDFE